METQELDEVTVCCTACGRPDLLERTLDSFLKFNTYPIKEFFVYEDSGTNCNDHLHSKYPFITWLSDSFRRGQIHALDTMYQKVKTKWVMQLEEDWEFYREGFIEASMPILQNDPKICTVWLREKEDTNQHPIIWEQDFGIMKTNHNGLWGGWTWNPGLRRKSDYTWLGAYGNHTQFNRKKPWLAEAAVSKLYSSAGYRAAILKQGYVRHIGENRHVS